MENDQIEEPSWPTLDNSEEQENPTMTPSDSFEIRGPFRAGPKEWMYELLDDGEIIADVRHGNQSTALTNALLLAAAPRMADLLEGLADEFWVSWLDIQNGYAESQGIKCEACETPGQPSRMVFCPAGRPYHKTCVPDDVKRKIAEEEKAADLDGDVEF